MPKLAATMEPVVQPPADGTAKVEQVRELLFGPDLRQIDQNLQQVNDTIRQQGAQLRDEMRRRLDAFELVFKQEVEGVQAQLRRERDERVAGDAQLARASQEASDSGQRRLADYSDQFATAQAALRSELLSQMKSLFDEITLRDDRWSKLIESRLGELGQKKTDRVALSTLLSEMAARLGQDSDRG